ncbi:MAG: hypothetical protein KDK06_04905 [Gammaproteobacteria bacterium]|nr:hypothetical protein [Gammaproteobacteria bacterium]
MSAVEHEILGRFAQAPAAGAGPVTAARRRRNALVYAGVAMLALAPTLFGAAPGWQAAGFGLLLPGAGFLAWGGAWVLLLPFTLVLFWLACVAWFWAGNIVAPLGVWLGAAAVAGAWAGPTVWAPAVWLAPAAAVAVGGALYLRGARQRAADRERYAARQAFYAESRAEVEQRVTPELARGARELSPEQLGALRYVFERALQPVGEYAGYTIIDQFQPAALRYQINHLGYALAISQTHYTPSFSGYLDQAQRNLIETYLDPKVWSYWVLESMWGHFNFSNFDPARKDNVMLTGYLGLQVNGYMLASGDRRYGEPGSLTFRLNEHTAYRHDAHTIAGSVLANFERSDFCLFPCEPNWIYPVCNMYGLGSVAAHDAVFGRHDAARVLPRWMAQLEREFVDEKGSIVGLRSYLTGHALGIFNGEAGFAFFANVFSPALARRLWAVGRRELGFCVAPDAEGRPRLTIPREAMSFLDTIDVGHYKPGMLFAYAAVAICGREFGDHELADAAIRSMDQDCGRVEEDGVIYYKTASGMANAWAVEAKLLGTGGFRNTFVKGPAATALRGPRLAEATYPEVLVARAVSDGEDLELVLYPGRASGTQTLGFDRLQPGRRYRVEGIAEGDLAADAQGRAHLDIALEGRTALRLVPAA